LAYDLQKSKTQQEIVKEEVQIDIVERRKLVDVEEKEILRFEKFHNNIFSTNSVILKLY